MKLEDTFPPQVLELLDARTRFHAAVEQRAEPLQIEPEELPKVFKQDINLFGVPTLYNESLHLYGRPDGVRTAGGALLPIEVKSHAAIHRSDFLELAFYWLLLEPFRTVTDVEPTGYLILRENDEAVECEFPTPAHRIDQVQKLIARVRVARRDGVRRRICGCRVCSYLRRDEVREDATSRKDLSLLFNVGPCYGEVMEGLGVNTYEELIDADSETISDAMRELKYYGVTPMEVERWKCHARSWVTGEPVYFGDGYWPIGDSFIALDLEYAGHIWGIGVVVVRSGVAETFQCLWADSDAEVAANLRRLERIFLENPTPSQ